MLNEPEYQCDMCHFIKPASEFPAGGKDLNETICKECILSELKLSFHDFKIETGKVEDKYYSIVNTIHEHPAFVSRGWYCPEAAHSEAVEYCKDNNLIK